ncbi:hypothetical protein WH47_01954 [Habropoda laboriosa]|uniref:Uncharacterized protein n=1 Tax=Habropoda laboriosa TaxID=597456 RepID=A0A0L7QY38_9HYME|nr:hypothetical protein WH47_01954 [Habropoda laboriosa]
MGGNGGRKRQEELLAKETRCSGTRSVAARSLASNNCQGMPQKARGHSVRAERARPDEGSNRNLVETLTTTAGLSIRRLLLMDRLDTEADILIDNDGNEIAAHFGTVYGLACASWRVANTRPRDISLPFDESPKSAEESEINYFARHPDLSKVH